MAYNCGENKTSILTLGVGSGSTKEKAIEDAKKQFEKLVNEDYEGRKKESCPSECRRIRVFSSIDPDPPQLSSPKQTPQGEWVCAFGASHSITIYCLDRRENEPDKDPGDGKPIVHWKE